MTEGLLRTGRAPKRARAPLLALTCFPARPSEGEAAAGFARTMIE